MTIVTDDAMGGDARLAGHRIAVYHIVQFREAGFEPEEIAEEYDLDVGQVRAALDYAERHPDEIGRALEATGA